MKLFFEADNADSLKLTIEKVLSEYAASQILAENAKSWPQLSWSARLKDFEFYQ